MAIARDCLDALARHYVVAMTSIRGRRVHRLLMREFARHDHVLPAVTEGGSAALLAIADDGRAAVCRSDGRGPTAAIEQWARLDGATVTVNYDLLKDSLPIVGWTVWHASLARSGGALAITAAGLSAAEVSQVADGLRVWQRA